MRTFKYKINASREELIALLSDNDKVNKGVNSEYKKGTAHMHVDTKGEKIKMRCEFIGGATKDNAFIDGTKLRGKIVEKDGYTEFRGAILTAPIFHALLILMFSAFVVMCIVKQGFNVVPVCLVIFDIFMYRDEFKKQDIIDKYVFRAVKILNRSADSERNS